MTLFDSSIFLESLGDDPELASELLDAYLEDSPVRKEALGRAIAELDYVSAAKAAHSLKGMSGVVRASGLIQLALEMEIAAKNEDEEKLRSLYESFEKAFAEASREMHDFYNGL